MTHGYTEAYPSSGRLADGSWLSKCRGCEPEGDSDFL